MLKNNTPSPVLRFSTAEPSGEFSRSNDYVTSTCGKTTAPMYSVWSGSTHSIISFLRWLLYFTVVTQLSDLKYMYFKLNLNLGLEICKSIIEDS